jgi:penicillin-binding protein 1C
MGAERPFHGENPGLWRSRWPGFLALALLALLLSACVAPAQQLGPRPGKTPLEAAEAYLQRFQPGVTPRVFQTTRILDRRGTLLAELWSEGRRTWIPLSRVSQHLIDATIAAEDSTFYINSGVDTVRVVGAALQNYEEGEVVSGASTITMQLARNLFLDADERFEQSMNRKMLEAGLAQDLTTLFSKDEILEMYLNLANYSHLAYGPEAASQVYFAKPASQLTLAEATLIAGIPQRPAVLDPFKNLPAVKERQRTVLDMMVRHGRLTQAAADAAYQQPIVLNPDPDRRTNLLPHYVNYVADVLDMRLGSGAGTRSGLTITGTLDVRFQSLAQEIVAKQVKALQPTHDLSNGALVAMLPYSGEILAMVGSADFNNDKIAGQVNVARSLRQPGSAIKPVLYAAAMDDLLISPATVLWDIPVSYPITGTKPYTPSNYDQKFHGPVTVRTALANSYNVPAVKLLEAVTVDRMLRGAEVMGIRSLSKSAINFGLALTLGGGDVTLLELTTAYSVLASEGRSVAPEPILGAVDAYGRPVLNARRPQGEPLQAVSSSTAFLLTDILADNEARTPMFGANSPLLLSKPGAAKTGTTDDWRDNWTIGYTRFLVAGAWTGNSDGHPMKRVSGIAGAAPIWHEFMEAVLKQPELLDVIGATDPSDQTTWQFSPPLDVELRDACPPQMRCRQGGEYFSKAWLDAAGEAGPLADTVAQVPSAPVYALRPDSGRWTAYCQTEPAAVRGLLKLPGPLGLARSDEAASSSLPEPAGDTSRPVSFALRELSNPQPAGESQAPRQVDVLKAVAWSVRTPTPVDLGPCASLQETVRQALQADPRQGDAALSISVDLDSAMNPKAGPIAGNLASATDSPAPVTEASPGEFRFALGQAIQNHSNCPGHYIVGAVLGQNGASMGGVRIVMVDEWGNRAEAVSKTGAADAGQYDFPINSFANRYTLTVVDSSGSPISAPVTVEHLQGYGGSSPCHTVVWQAY